MNGSKSNRFNINNKSLGRINFYPRMSVLQLTYLVTFLGTTLILLDVSNVRDRRFLKRKEKEIQKDRDFYRLIKVVRK